MAKNKKYDKGGKNKLEGSVNKPKVVKTVSTEKKAKVKLSPTKTKSANKNTDSGQMLFGPKNYYLMLGALALIILGFILMSGGAQEANEWNSKEIYSARRITLAPIAILSGLGLIIYAIFKKQDQTVEE